MKQTKQIGRFITTIACAMLFVMTFTAVTAFADDEDTINASFDGKYQNQSNTWSNFIINSSGEFNIVTHATKTNFPGGEKYFTGAGHASRMGMGKNGLYSKFVTARETDENGNVINDMLLKDVVFTGQVISGIGWGGLEVTVIVCDIRYKKQ